MLSAKLSQLSVSPIKQIELRASKLDGVVSLAQGIPSFDTPEPIKRKVKEAMDKGWTAKYSLTPGLPILRELIAENLREQNIFIDFEEEIIITSGATEGIVASLLAILNPGEEVLLVSPSYASYAEYIKVAGGRPIFIPLDDENNGWTLNISLFKRALTDKTKAIILCNPNNPTGTIFSKEQLIQLAEVAKKYGLYLLVDEVYRDFIYNDATFFSISEIPEFKDRVIRFFSFSKLYAMTGWRIGYLHSSKRLVKEILKVHDALVTCAPVISQYAALAALEMPKEYTDRHMRYYKSRRQLMAEQLNRLVNVFSYHIPDSSYFFFPKVVVPHSNSWSLAIDILEKAKVATVPGSGFGPSGESHLRFNFGREEQEIIEAFNRLEYYFKKYV